jgi:hypothetical protein
VLGDLVSFSAIHSFAAELGDFSKNFLNHADLITTPSFPRIAGIAASATCNIRRCLTGSFSFLIPISIATVR